MITTQNIRNNKTMVDKPYNPRIQSGFTMIELLVTLTIVAILASIAMPTYQSYGERTRRTDAKIALSNSARILERCMIEYDAYNSGSCSSDLASNTTITSPEGFYNIIPTVTATTFTLTASPISGKGQENDSGCTAFTLTQAGAQGATGSNSSTCW